jgi:DNA-binding winged helix-turn-helix (wHTH) protein
MPKRTEKSTRELAFPALGPDAEPAVLRFAEFSLDLRRRALSREGQRIHLTEKPLSTLIFLVAHHGRVVTKRQLMDEVWKDTIVTEDNLVQAVGEIRRALGDDKDDPRFVQTVPREGYRFLARVEEAGESIAEVIESTPSATPQIASPRSPRRWVVGVVSVVVIAATTIVVQRMRSSGEVDERLGVAVFPFRPLTREATEYAEALPDLVATILDGTPGVRVADPWALWRPLRNQPSAVATAPDPARGEDLARRVRVRRFVLGSIVGAANRLEVAIRVYQPNGEPRTIVESAPPDSLAALAQRLAVAVIATVYPRSSAPSVPPIERRATKSAGALKAYLAAKEAQRRGFADSADRAIDRALALDSTFALALVDAVVIKGWVQFMLGRTFRLLPLATSAASRADSLDERNRLRALSTLASVRTEGVAAAAAAERIIRLDSSDLDAWHRLSYYHRVYGWQYGKGEREATEAAANVLRLDSTYAPALIASAQIATSNGTAAAMARAEQLLRRADTTGPGVRGALIGLRAVGGTDAEFDAIIDSVAAGRIADWFGVVRTVRAKRPDRAARLLERLRSRPATPTSFAPATTEARLMLATGSLTALDSLTRSGAFTHVARFDAVRSAVTVGAAIGGIRDSSSDVRAVALLGTLSSPDSALAQSRTQAVWANGWLIGAWHAMYGDTTMARRWHAAMGTLPRGGTPKDYIGGIQADFDARLEARRGNLTAALEHARRAYDLYSIHSENLPEEFPEPGIRFHLASLLRATGRSDSAAAIFSSFVPPTMWASYYTVRAWLELGELAERRGDRTAAHQYYDAALRFWRRGGPEIAGWRRRAEAGLERTRR